jgi:nucleotide-binding universal stress UspA family protein
VAERTGAALVVVGSSHRGPVGRVLPGSTGERLLHGSPCPVAIVPRGHAQAPIETIAVGHDGSAESDAALATACALAARFRASLRVIRVFDPSAVAAPLVAGINAGPYLVELERDRREELERVVAGLADDVHGEAVFLTGSPGRELVGHSQSADLMVVGSRGYGPARAVLLGGVSHVLVRDAACPVLVLPRGSRHEALDSLLGAFEEASAP